MNMHFTERKQHREDTAFQLVFLNDTEKIYQMEASATFNYNYMFGEKGTSA